MSVSQAMTDPWTFFEGDPTEREKRRVLAVVLATGLVPTLGGVAGVLALLSDTFGAGLVAFVALVALLVGVAMAVGAWLLWAGAMYVVGRLLGGEGSFRGLLFDVGWGFLPRVGAVAVGVVPNLLALGRLEPVTVDPATDPEAFGRALAESAGAGAASGDLALGAWAVALLALGASAYLWLAAVERGLALSRGRAAVAVGVPVAVSVLVRLTAGLAPLL